MLFPQCFFKLSDKIHVFSRLRRLECITVLRSIIRYCPRKRLALTGESKFLGDVKEARYNEYKKNKVERHFKQKHRSDHNQYFDGDYYKVFHFVPPFPQLTA